MSAESPSPPPSSPPPPPVTAAAQHWCYHCDKRVSVESHSSQPDDVICSECKFGFVESIPPTAAASNSSSLLSPPPESVAFSEELTLGNQFIQVLRLLAQLAPEDDAPPLPPISPPPPPITPLSHRDDPPPDDSDFLRIEIDGWDEDDSNNLNLNGNRNNNGDVDDDDEEEEEEEEEDDDDEDDEVRSVEIEGHTDEDEDEEEREEEMRRRRRDVLRLRLRDFANRARSEGRHRIVDWAEILMGLEDNSIEFRFEVPEANDRYIGNPGDYVDAAEYEALLQNLADAEGRRGAPPASKAAVEELKVVEMKTVEESYACAICKDMVNVGECVKEMPCGHGYHGDCIVPWLAARNSCPVCRFELPTDDAEYEEERRKKKFPGSSSGSSAGNIV